MLPSKIYATVLEEEALEQYNDAMKQPFVIAGALMADAHKGYSLPIGAVVATLGWVVPSWVGYDIGCGMCALRLDGIDLKSVEANSDDIFEFIYRDIPVGFHKNVKPTPYSLDGLTAKGEEIAILKTHDRALGSLGGGNHFIEIGYDEEDAVWVIIHSGSRGVGHGIATHYMKTAHPEGRPKEGHHGFHQDSPEGKDYIQDLNWCLDFALANRKEMMKRVVNCITEALDMDCYELDFSELINRNHNHAIDKGNVWVHRKGATQAEEGMLGVIPGNMRDGSFIVRGKGNPASIHSSSHGAGRVYGRKEAKRILNMEDFTDTMQGVTALVTADTLDESPEAYKNIFEVMEAQKDLVDIVHHVKPIINIKG